MESLRSAGAPTAALARYESALHALAAQNRLRALRPQSGVDFSSNDYLGLAASARMRSALATALARGTAIGAGGSRLLRGNHPEHERSSKPRPRRFFTPNAHFSSAAAMPRIPRFSQHFRRATI